MRWDAAALLGLTLLAGMLNAAAARAEQAPACEVPAYLLTSESPLPKVAEAVKQAQKLDILVVGSRSSTITSAEATAYPGRLEAVLRDKLPAVNVTISVELQVKKTAEEVAAGLGKLVVQVVLGRILERLLCRPAALLSRLVQERVAQDRRQPRGQVAARPEPAPPAERTQVGLLHQLLGHLLRPR